MNTKNLNFIFFGTPDVASETLEILKRAGFLPSLIVTSPDKPQGRKMLVTPPPVKIWAMENNIPYIQPESFTPSAFSTSPLLRGRLGRGPDLFVVVAYGKILPEKIINMPKFGSINVHYSLLPKYRGASPVESAILNGDIKTGVTIQKMAYKLDSGNILAQEKVKILETETAPELKKRLIKIGGELLVKILKTPSADGHSPFAGGEEQDESQATFCKKIKKEDGLITESDLRKSETDQSKSVMLYNKFRAYAHWPRTFFFQNNKRIIITNAELVGEKFTIKKILPEGKKEIDYKVT